MNLAGSVLTIGEEDYVLVGEQLFMKPVLDKPFNIVYCHAKA